MNYFAHYYFYRSKAHTAHFTAGLLLPDLARFSEGKKKLELQEENPLLHEKEIEELNAGCAAHYHTDALFHSAATFDNMVGEIKTIFRQHNFSPPGFRIWFVTHILAELVFDRVLIRKYPGDVDRFYALLSQCNTPLVCKYLLACDRSNTDRFARYFEGFTSSQFLRKYVDDHEFVFALNRTMAKVDQPPIEDDTLLTFIKMLPEMETAMERHEKAIERIFV